MTITGQHFIGGKQSAAGDATFEAVNPATGEALGPAYHEAALAEVDEALQLADAAFDALQTVSWETKGGTTSIKLLPGKTYVRPSGYKVHMEKPPGNRAWRLIGTVAEGTLCHKPCTVSGGGKSEISKPITDAIIQGPVFVSDFKKDFDLVAEGPNLPGSVGDSWRTVVEVPAGHIVAVSDLESYGGVPIDWRGTCELELEVGPGEVVSLNLGWDLRRRDPWGCLQKSG